MTEIGGGNNTAAEGTGPASASARIATDGTGTVYRSQFDLDEDESITLAVLDAVAAVANTTTDQLPRLASYVDPNALNLFFDDTDGTPVKGTRLTFPFAGYSVTVTGDGFIFVRPVG